MSPALAALGDVCVARSSLVDPRDPEFHQLPHIAPDTIERNTGNLHPYRSVLEDGVTSGKYRFEPGDVLYSKIRPNLNKVAQVDFAGLCSADMYALDVDRTRATPSYVAHLLRSDGFLDYATTLSNRANIPKLNRAQLLTFRFHLPPLDEQRRITAILDQAAIIRAKRRRALAHLDDLTQSIFEARIGLVDWRRLPLKELTTKVGSGATPRGGAGAYKESGTALIRSMNIHDGRFVWKNLAFLDDAQAAALSNVEVAANDVLLNITGASVARVARAPESVLPARVNQHVAIIRPDPSRLHPRVLESYLMSPRTKRQLLHVATGGATREAITKAQILALQVPVPDLSVQRDFVQTVSSVDQLRANAELASAEGDRLVASVQDRFFKGHS